MAKIGQSNTLKIIRSTPMALFLDGGELGTLVVPRESVSKDGIQGDLIKVFILTDEQGLVAASTKMPKANIGEFCSLEVVSVTDFGAFLDWGIDVDLFVPVREQVRPMELGEICVVYLFLDKKNSKITGSSRVESFLDAGTPNYATGRQVKLLIYEKTKLGFKAIIDNTHWGMLYHNEVFQELEVGRSTNGYIKKMRGDGKIDLWLEKPGGERVDEGARKILAALRRNNGSLSMTDASPPQIISQELGMSKKTFKKALGNLYKRRIIVIGDGTIRLTRRPPSSAG